MQKKICNPGSIYVDEKEEICLEIRKQSYKAARRFIVLPVKPFAGLPAKW